MNAAVYLAIAGKLGVSITRSAVMRRLAGPMRRAADSWRRSGLDAARSCSREGLGHTLWLLPRPNARVQLQGAFPSGGRDLDCTST